MPCQFDVCSFLGRGEWLLAKVKAISVTEFIITTPKKCLCLFNFIKWFVTFEFRKFVCLFSKL